MTPEEAERLKEQNADYERFHEALKAQITRVCDESDHLRDLASNALSEAERVIRAYAAPESGMGTNIIREDRGRAAHALREIERVREVLNDRS